MSIHNLFDHRISGDMQKCVRKLLEHADGGAFTGMAFVGYIEGRGWIADVCGLARLAPLDAKEMLPALSAKLDRLARRAGT